MNRRLAGIVVAGALIALVTAPEAGAAPNANAYRHVCGTPAQRHARCLSDVVTDEAGTPLATAGPAGYGPADLQSAYGAASAAASAGGTMTVAIVDAYDDPSAEADMGTYRVQYGLPACTTGTGCFRKVNQSGGTTPPTGNVGWGQEMSLDLDMVSAVCPNCKVLLVEANSNSFADLAAAVDRAAALGANQISNSYGGSEYSAETTDQAHFNHPGIDITVSSGDNGYGVEFPAASQYVTAVGGTTLSHASTARGWSETTWSGAGSGCSAYVAKPSWQKDTGCARRMVADVSAVADPNTGVAVYDSYCSASSGCGWLVFGGTSAAAPIVASVDALAGGRAASPNSYGSFSYANPSMFNDVTSGSNGRCLLVPAYFCTAGAGYDGPTGNGTPNGVTTAGTGGGGGGTTTGDFALSASPSTGTATRGQTASYTITVTPQNGYAGAVSLSATGQPGGSKSSFSPPTTTSTSVFSVSPGRGSKPGTYTITVTGSDGTRSHTTSVTLTVN